MDLEFEPLSAAQARVLGVLVEKQHTVPDTYPLTLNALVAGCNQKTSRQPVMELGEGEVLQALDDLKGRHLVTEVSGARATRFDHNMARGLNVPSQGMVLLTLLMLRGPQTAAELRLNCERLHRFADVSSVEAFLDELAAKTPARVVKLARAPGAREARWMHLLCGAPSAELLASLSSGEGAGAASGTSTGVAAALAALQAQVDRQAEEIGALRAELVALKAELGVGGSGA
jgi:uncharacterized protein